MILHSFKSLLAAFCVRLSTVISAVHNIENFVSSDFPSFWTGSYFPYAVSDPTLIKYSFFVEMVLKL
jgi:hypothetical protein